jgi:hypothetical protein
MGPETVMLEKQPRTAALSHVQGHINGRQHMVRDETLLEPWLFLHDGTNFMKAYIGTCLS